MKTETPTADTTAQPDATAQWLAELLYWVDMVDGGALSRLDALITAMPQGTAMFAASTKLFDRMSISPEALDPVGEAVNIFGARVGNRANSTGTSFAMLARLLLERVDQLLDAGAQDPDDPIIRRAMFGEVGVDQFGRLVGFARRMSPDCPLADVKPVTMDASGPMYVLGHPKAKHWRKSVAKRLTDGTNQRLDDERAERERIAEAERVERQRANANHPTVLAARIKELEQEIAGLKCATK
jgi:hypothetical protein